MRWIVMRVVLLVVATATCSSSSSRVAVGADRREVAAVRSQPGAWQGKRGEEPPGGDEPPAAVAVRPVSNGGALALAAVVVARRMMRRRAFVEACQCRSWRMVGNREKSTPGSYSRSI